MTQSLLLALKRKLTILHWAAENGHAAVAEVLLAGGAQVNAKDKASGEMQ